MTIVSAIVVTVAMLVFAAGQTVAPAAPLDLSGIAAMIMAGVGVVSFLISLYRGRKNNKKVGEIEDAADYVKQIDSLTKRLRDEVEEIRQEQHEERNKWIEERSLLQGQLEQLRKEHSDQVIENYKLKAELSKIKELLQKYLDPQEYEDFTKHL